MMTEVQIDNDDICLTTDDHLKVLKFLADDIFESKWSKGILWLLLVVHGVVTLITTCWILFVLNRKEFTDLSVVYFGLFYAMFALSIALFRGKLTSYFILRLERWTMDSLDKVTRGSIERETLCLKIIVVLLFSLAIISGFLMVPILPNDRSFYFALNFFDTYLPNCNVVLAYLYKCTFPFTQYISVVQSCLCLYCTQHIKVQLIMFKQYIDNIPNKTDDLNDLTYQEEVRKRLLIAIKRSYHFLKILALTLKEIKYLSLGFAVCGGILGISVVVSFGSVLLTPEYYPTVAMLCIVGVVAFSCTIWAGQSVESEIEELWKTVTIVNWYNFDKNNRKLYLIFLINLMKDRKIKFSEKYSLNYDLGLTIVKRIYSTASVLFTVMHS